MYNKMQLYPQTLRLALLGSLLGVSAATAGRTVQFVFTSDPLFGANRSEFHGEKNIDARYANAEMVAKINSLPTVRFPDDGEPGAGQTIGAFDFVAVGGNITARQDAATLTRSASDSWKDFEKVYLQGVKLKNAQGQSAPVLYNVGVQDVNNAVGYYKRLDPKTDPGVLVETYNRMVAPTAPLAADKYDYQANRPIYSRDVGGVHLVFTGVWPDSTVRAWMEKDLAKVGKDVPVLVFAHSTPDIDPKYLTNPTGKHDINKDDKFENVVPEMLIGGEKVSDKSTANERRFAQFAKAYPQIQGYFHGGGTVSDLKLWMGPDYDFVLPAFSADSPVKGETSGKDESQASFLVATVDLDAHKLTVRECRWNPEPTNRKAALAWGNHQTFEFRSAAAPVAEAPAAAPVVETPVAAPAAPAVVPAEAVVAPAPTDSTVAPAAPVAP